MLQFATVRKVLSYIVTGLLIGAVIYFLGTEVAKNWEQIRSFPFDFNIPLLALSSGLYIGSLFILAIGWYFLFQYFKYPISLSEAFIYFFATQPAKYIPGKIWIPITRMRLCKPHGIPQSITFLTTIIEAVMEIFAGAYLSSLIIGEVGFEGGGAIAVQIGICIVGLMLLIPKVFYFIIDIYLKLTKHPPLEKVERVSFKQLLVLQIIYVGGVALLGISHAVFLQSFIDLPASQFQTVAAIGAFSYIASILAFFSPSGLGVREGIWYVALKKIIAAPAALVFSFVSRLWNVALEVIAALIALLFVHSRRHRQNPTHRS